MPALAPSALAACAREAHVFARVSPAQKLEVVRALQADGAVVAMVGDGFNDGPALRAADVGIATGVPPGSGEVTRIRQVSAAREAADMVLLDNELDALATAIELGRATQANVRRASRYLLGTNLSEITVVLAATAGGISDSLSPLQLLWINLVSDVLPGLGLACEPPAPGLMEHPPRVRGEPILRGADWLGLAREGGIIAGGAMTSGVLGLLRHGAGPEARGMAFGTLVMAQLLHALTCRGTERGGASANKPLMAALAVTLGAQVVALLMPGLRSRLGIVPIGLLDIGITVAGGLLPYLFNESLASVPTVCSAASSTCASARRSLSDSPNSATRSRPAI
jgi:P-type Ca2+ transporter type 2C